MITSRSNTKAIDSAYPVFIATFPQQISDPSQDSHKSQLHSEQKVHQLKWFVKLCKATHIYITTYLHMSILDAHLS